jgi:hypothetical protein
MWTSTSLRAWTTALVTNSLVTRPIRSGRSASVAPAASSEAHTNSRARRALNGVGGNVAVRVVEEPVVDGQVTAVCGVDMFRNVPIARYG